MVEWIKDGKHSFGAGMKFNMYFKIQIASSRGEVHVVMMESKFCIFVGTFHYNNLKITIKCRCQ